MPPEDLHHATYSQRSIFGSNIFDRTIYLLPDGTYVGLSSWTKLSGRSPMTRPLGNGTYSYSVDETTKLATLTITPEGEAHSARLMAFTSETGGSLDLYGETFNIQRGPGEHPLSNTSVRSTLAPDGRMTAGFVVTREGGYLLRVVGPTLREFGVEQVVESPLVTFHRPDGTSTIMGSWQDGIPAVASLQKLATVVGAFPLDPESDEAVWFARLTPGVYMIEALNQGTTSGDVLIEAYPLP